MPVRIRGHVEYPKRAEPIKPEHPRTGWRECRRWTEQEDAIVRKAYRDSGAHALAKLLKRHYRAVQSRACHLGVAERRA